MRNLLHQIVVETLHGHSIIRTPKVFAAIIL